MIRRLPATGPGRPTLLFALIVFGTGCTIPDARPLVRDAALDGSAISQSTALSTDRPDGAAPGTCWHKTIAPAVLETRTTRTLIQPADIGPGGEIRTPARYRTESRTELVTPRRVNWIETICPEVFTPDFTASLQRALTVRGFAAGPADGMLSAATRAAVSRYQSAEGLQGGEDLSIEAAQRLGLITTDLSTRDAT
ncbi:MAG: peptidoglycan-binding domain-containing protein [Pseudomonadota bacterium]